MITSVTDAYVWLTSALYDWQHSLWLSVVVWLTAALYDWQLLLMTDYCDWQCAVGSTVFVWMTDDCGWQRGVWLTDDYLIDRWLWLTANLCDWQLTMCLTYDCLIDTWQCEWQLVFCILRSAVHGPEARQLMSREESELTSDSGVDETGTYTSHLNHKGAGESGVRWTMGNS